MVPAVDDHRRTLGTRAGHVAGDLVTVLGSDQRAHLAGWVVAWTDHELCHALGDGGDERIGDLADSDDHADRHAALAC